MQVLIGSRRRFIPRASLWQSLTTRAVLNAATGPIFSRIIITACFKLVHRSMLRTRDQTKLSRRVLLELHVDLADRAGLVPAEEPNTPWSEMLRSRTHLGARC